jgi:hypothetical protein
MGEYQYNHPRFVFVLRTECSREGGRGKITVRKPELRVVVDEEIRPCFCTSTFFVSYDCNGKKNVQLDTYIVGRMGRTSG